MIGKVIGGLLSNNASITGITGTKIFAYAIDEDVKLPAIIYRVPTTNSNFIKDEVVNDESNIEVILFTESYLTLQNLIGYVRGVLNGYKGVYPGTGINVLQSRINSINEDFDIDNHVYVGQLNLQIKYE